MICYLLKNIPKKALALSVISLLGVSACSLNMKATEDQANQNIKVTNELVNQATKSPSDSLIHFDNSIFVSDKPFEVEAPKAPLPPVFKEDFIFNSNDSMTLDEIASEVSSQTGLLIRVTEDAKQYVTGNNNTSNTSNKAQTGNVNAPPLSLNSSVSNDNSEPTMRLNYVGSLEDLLQQVVRRFKLFWKYNQKQNSVEIFRYETKTFELSLVRGQSTSKSTIKNGDANSLSPQISSLDVDSGIVDQWKSAEESINKILNGDGNVTTLPSTGFVTVTTTPVLMERVEEYINTINTVAGKVVLVQVDVYNVEQTASSNYGLDWNVVMKASSGLLKWNTTGIADALANPFTSAQTATISAGLTGGALSGSEVLLQALQHVGKITSKSSPMAYTLNGQPVSLNLSQQQSYIEKMDSNVQTGSSADYITSSVTPSTINTGFTLKLTPYIEKKDKVILNMSLIMNNLKSIRREKTGSEQAQGYVELPTVDSKSFAYMAKLKSGQAIIIAAFNDESANTEVNSITGEDSWGLGGKKGTAKTHAMTVVSVTPYIVGGQ
ncbi:hypothetical protein [Cysteiniphilum marinum]|uniref:hypothetical protein n=1 Tax=Cysteiniphilum marinum TaxID=2774191 RepID=UPI00193A2AEE|nr:hypothetical protein [Cysteiniphilum marinum]